MHIIHSNRLNSNGLPELLIGANERISGIYALQNGTPVSVIQVEARYNLSLLMDSDGKCVIEHLWGRMGYSKEFFYTIDKDEKLVTSDKLYTYGDYKKIISLSAIFELKTSWVKNLILPRRNIAL